MGAALSPAVQNSCTHGSTTITLSRCCCCPALHHCQGLLLAHSASPEIKPVHSRAPAQARLAKPENPPQVDLKLFETGRKRWKSANRLVSGCEFLPEQLVLYLGGKPSRALFRHCGVLSVSAVDGGTSGVSALESQSPSASPCRPALSSPSASCRTKQKTRHKVETSREEEASSGVSVGSKCLDVRTSWKRNDAAICFVRGLLLCKNPLL